jgi:hypothetical protein
VTQTSASFQLPIPTLSPGSLLERESLLGDLSRRVATSKIDRLRFRGVRYPQAVGFRFLLLFDNFFILSKDNSGLSRRFSVFQA